MTPKKDNRSHQITIGLILVFLGGIFLLDQIDVLAGDAFSRYWPVLLIVLGTGHLVRERRGGVPWLMVVGGIMLLHTLDILRLHDSWPLFIVAAGLGWVWSGWRGETVCCCDPGDGDDD